MADTPVFSIVGYSGTGKTTFLEKLIVELKKRGLKLAVIKHDAHRFEIDREGKDSWRFTQAGADMVAICSKEKSAFVVQGELALHEVLSGIHGADLILTEGYRHEKGVKIAVYRKASGNPLPGAPGDFDALVTDTPFDGAAPQFGLSDARGVADFIVARMGERV